MVAASLTAAARDPGPLARSSLNFLRLSAVSPAPLPASLQRALPFADWDGYVPTS